MFTRRLNSLCTTSGRCLRLDYNHYTTIPNFCHSNSGINNFVSSNILQIPKDDTPNRLDQDRKANLGMTIENLRRTLPKILQKSLPKSIISKDIVLRICPTHLDEFNAYLPSLKGQSSYYATCKAIQLVMTSVILNPKIQLHIQSIRTSYDHDSQAIYPDSTKIHVRWTTCCENCPHLSMDNDTEFHSTSVGRFGSHRWAKINSESFIQSQDSSNFFKTMTTIKSAMKGLSKESEKLERVISGIFIFELNPMNDEIIVHTIEDIEIIEKPELEEVGGLRIC